MPITRSLALKIIKYLLDNPSFNFPFLIMCKGYASDTNNENFIKIVPENDYKNLLKDSIYDTFELWEDLQNLDLQTLELLSRGFMEKILSEENYKIEKDFIFITFEGMTFQPRSESDISDIENMQVIGFEKGFDMNNAFENLKQNQKYLENTSFDEIIGIELKNKKFSYYNLKSYE